MKLPSRDSFINTLAEAFYTLQTCTAFNFASIFVQFTVRTPMEGDQPLTLKFGNSGSKNRFAPFWFLGFIRFWVSKRFSHSFAWLQGLIIIFRLRKDNWISRAPNIRLLCSSKQTQSGPDHIVLCCWFRVACLSSPSCFPPWSCVAFPLCNACIGDAARFFWFWSLHLGIQN